MRLCPGQSVKKNMRKMDGGDATEMTFYSQVHCCVKQMSPRAMPPLPLRGPQPVLANNVWHLRLPPPNSVLEVDLLLGYFKIFWEICQWRSFHYLFLHNETLLEMLNNLLQMSPVTVTLFTWTPHLQWHFEQVPNDRFVSKLPLVTVTIWLQWHFSHVPMVPMVAQS